MKFTVSDANTLIGALELAFPGTAKNTLRSWLKYGRVSLDGRVEKIPTRPVAAGQSVSLSPKEKGLKKGLKILFEDKHIVAVEKPEGLLSVSTAFEEEDTVFKILKKHYHPKPVFVVHRLDQDTSGVMLFALSQSAMERLKEIFEEHRIERRYAAIVRGHLHTKSGTWRSYLYEDARYTVHTTKDKNKGQLAITHYTVLGESKNHSWLDVSLETGRKNQIRVHCKEAGHPVLGDKKYGPTPQRTERLYLHARLLSLEHPMTQKGMHFESPVPEAFYKIVKPKAETPHA